MVVSGKIFEWFIQTTNSLNFLPPDNLLPQDNQGLVRLQELLKAPTQRDVKVVVKQLSFLDQDTNK